MALDDIALRGLIGVGFLFQDGFSFLSYVYKNVYIGELPSFLSAMNLSFLLDSTSSHGYLGVNP